MENRDMIMAEKIASLVASQGGRTFFVGGFVRDRLLGKENKDIDIEIHGILPETLEEILRTLGKMTEMGASFGIFGLKGYDLDIAMPRKEEATGRGHKDFTVYVDPFLGTYKAALRRDFTMNALMQDVLTGEVIDHFGGISDMERGILRHVNEVTFVEDPLRVLRAAQFAARFHFQVAPETVALARTMDLTALARERIMGELEKALLKAKTPSVFFEEMVKMDQMRDWFPELDQLRSIDSRWSETMKILDEAAKVREQTQNPLWFMMLALIHAMESPSVRNAFVKRVTSEVKLTKYVLNLAAFYQKPEELAKQEVDEKTTNTLFDQVIDPEDLVLFSQVVCMGKTGTSDEKTQNFLKERLQVFHRVMDKPFVMGADLVAAGLQPGKSFSEILAFAHELRLEEVEKKIALEKTLEYAKQIETRK